MHRERRCRRARQAGHPAARLCSLYMRAILQLEYDRNLIRCPRCLLLRPLLQQPVRFTLSVLFTAASALTLLSNLSKHSLIRRRGTRPAAAVTQPPPPGCRPLPHRPARCWRAWRSFRSATAVPCWTSLACCTTGRSRTPEPWKPWRNWLAEGCACSSSPTPPAVRPHAGRH